MRVRGGVRGFEKWRSFMLLHVVHGTVLQSSEAGVMERIELVDFMCHRKLDVPLSPNVNFILGRNGSEWSHVQCVLILVEHRCLYSLVVQGLVN